MEAQYIGGGGWLSWKHACRVDPDDLFEPKASPVDWISASEEPYVEGMQADTYTAWKGEYEAIIQSGISPGAYHKVVSKSTNSMSSKDFIANIWAAVNDAAEEGVDSWASTEEAVRRQEADAARKKENYRLGAIKRRKTAAAKRWKINLVRSFP